MGFISKIKRRLGIIDQLGAFQNRLLVDQQQLLTQTNQISTLQKMQQHLFQEQLTRDLQQELRTKFPDSLALFGASTYSQNDEDGILEEIFKRLSISEITFFEFGVATNENNGIAMLLNKARGCWYDKGLTEFKKSLGAKKNLHIFDDFITLENIESLTQQGLDVLKIGKKDLDLLSLDLDGNDYYLMDKIIGSGLQPKILCLEYNAKFRPPVDVKIAYNPDHQWTSDDYFGCSLQAYVSLLKKEYTLLVCNLSGINCFFVRNDLASKFTIYSVEDLYQPTRYYLSPYHKGHKSSTKFIQSLIE